MKFSMARIGRETQNNYRAWVRSKTALFWALAYPVLMIVIMGAAFGGMANDPTYTIGVQDLDDSPTSQILVDCLKECESLEIETIDIDETDVADWALDNKVAMALVIPLGFGQQVIAVRANLSIGLGVTAPAYVDIFYDPSSSSADASVSIVYQVVSGAQELGLSTPRAFDAHFETLLEDEGFSAMDYMLPGIIAVTIMSSASIGVVTQTAYDKKSGILERVSLTPLTAFEYLTAKMIFQAALGVFIALVSVMTSWAVWGTQISMNLWIPLLLILGALVFASFGQLMANWIDSPETAGAAVSAITFPQMFLAGSFWPLSLMPWYLQLLAKGLPLTYFNDALRSAMISPDTSTILFNGAITMVIGLIATTVAALWSKWKVE